MIIVDERQQKNDDKKKHTKCISYADTRHEFIFIYIWFRTRNSNQIHISYF